MAPDQPAALDDEVLARRFVAGDQAAFSELVVRHSDRVYGICFRMTGNEHDALDAAQETFLSAFRKAPGFEGRARFSTWIYRVAINACLDLHRKKTRAPIPLEEVAPADAEPDIADVVIERGALAKALRELGEDFREAVLMHDVGGIPYEAIARATGVSVGTVKSRISRGRRKLASALTSATSEEQARAGRPSEQRT